MNPTLLLRAALGLLLVNLLALALLYSFPLPDRSLLPGRTPVMDVGPGVP